jgi:uncharacterized membrane protein
VERKRQSRSANGREARRNIRAISELERKELERRSGAERCSDLVVLHAGRLWCLLVHSVWFGAWMVWNSGKIPGLKPFDPFPFSALTTVVSLEAIFLSLFILMSQNRANRRADERAHLDLQVNLLAEHETTKMLQLLQALCIHHKLPQAQDPEVLELLERTEPAELAREIEQELPAGR